MTFSTNKSRHDLSVFVARLQPLHCGHMKVIEEALDKSDHLCIVVGSSFQPRSFRNPFNFAERKQMIEDSLSKSDLDRVTILPVKDYYNDASWIEAVQNSVNATIADLGLISPRVTLIGHSKDHTSYYQNKFPQWDKIDVPNYLGLDATRMRLPYFSNMVDMWLANCDGHKVGDHDIEKLVPSAVREFLMKFSKTEDYAWTLREFETIIKYREQWRSSTGHITTDAVVIQSGHVLLIRRRGYPGKGLWALPGGFLNPEETLQRGMLRELDEETSIKVPEKVLIGNIKWVQTFDDPMRSPRGRIVTHAHLVHLPDGPLAKVRAGDDAEEAKWVPLAEIDTEVMFEDHEHIITFMKGKLNVNTAA